MATRGRKRGSSGRTTPKGGASRPSGPSGRSREPDAAKRRRLQDPDEPVMVGRRPSSPGFLAVVAVMWMAVGVILFFTLTTGWRLIPAIVAVGIGVLFLRGAVSTVMRRGRRQSER